MTDADGKAYERFLREGPQERLTQAEIIGIYKADRQAALNAKKQYAVSEKGIESGSDVWDMAEGGGIINGREYSQHAMERMVPDTPSVIEDAIRNTTAVQGHTAGTFVHQTADVTVIVNETGKVITVMPK